MDRKRYTPEQIVALLRKAEVLLSKGSTVGVRRGETSQLPGLPSTGAGGHPNGTCVRSIMGRGWCNDWGQVTETSQWGDGKA